MSCSNPWYLHRSDVVKHVKKWIKEYYSSPGNRETLLKTFSSILPVHKTKCELYWERLVDVQVTKALEKTGCLNWLESASKLHAIIIPDHNSSFCHSISVALWGIPDFKGHVSHMLKNSLKLDAHFWKKRFVQEITHTNVTDKYITPKHIFVMADFLQRPIIIVSNEDGDSPQHTSQQAGNDTFFGIYLPLGSKPISCSKTPIFLAYFKGVFYPLLVDFFVDELVHCYKNTYSIKFPLTTNSSKTYPLKFVLPQEEKCAGELMQDYLIVKEVSMTSSENVNLLLLQSNFKTFPEDRNMIFSFVKACLEKIEKPLSPTRFNFRPHIKIFTKLSEKSTLHTIKTDDDIVMESDGPGIVSDSNAKAVSNEPMHNTDTNVDFRTNTEVGMGEFPEIVQLEPSAPSMEVEEPLSMLDARCITCKSYRSSVNTFPYCHECFLLRNTKTSSLSVQPDAQTQNMNGGLHSIENPPNAEHSPDIRHEDNGLDKKNESRTQPLSDELKSRNESSIYPRLDEFKGKNESNMQPCSEASRPTNIRIIGTKFKRRSSAGDGNTEPLSSVSRPSSEDISDDLPGIFESVSQGTSTEEAMKCASPVCEKEIKFPELLCEKCVTILQAHNSSICEKPCCQNVTVTSIPNDKSTQKSHSSKSNSVAIESSNTGKSSDTIKSQTSIKDYSVSLSSKQPVIEQMPEEIAFKPDRSFVDLDFKNMALDNSIPYHETSDLFLRNHLKDYAKVKIPDVMNSKANVSRDRLIKPPSSANQEESCSHSNFSKGEDIEFDNVLKEFENTIKSGVKKCKTPTCNNFGTEEKNGVCNHCYCYRMDLNNRIFGITS